MPISDQEEPMIAVAGKMAQPIKSKQSIEDYRVMFSGRYQGNNTSTNPTTLETINATKLGEFMGTEQSPTHHAKQSLRDGAAQAQEHKGEA